MQMSNYQRKLDQRFRASPIADPPEPWRQTFYGSIGGLLVIGFAPGSDLLLVISAGGRGVFDCLTGDRVSRDDEIDGETWADPIQLTTIGVGPLDKQTVRVAGLWGGGMPVRTA